MTVETPELTKYNKRIEDLIEDAEIEAELEAESHIRSKNTRLILISAVGLICLIMVYWSINSKSKDTPPRKKPAFAKSSDYIPNPKPIPFPLDQKFKPVPDQKLASVSPVSSLPLRIEPEKPKVASSKTVKPDAKKSKPVLAFPKKSASEPPLTLGYFIQIGAFSVKKNADSLVNKLKVKGLSPKIHSISGRAETFSVFVGEFKDKKSGQSWETDLKRSGFSPKIQAYGKGRFSFTVGQFKTHQEAQDLKNKLSKSGFLPGLHHDKGKTSTFIVSVGRYRTLKEAKSEQIKIKNLGYPNSFPKKID